MPWTFAYLGYGAGVFPPGKSDPALFLRAAHTMALAQSESLRALKAASPKATVGSAYGMAPAYPKTDSAADRAATARYHASNNVFFLHAAMTGEYPKAFVGEVPYKQMGFRPGDEKIMKAPLDWVGFHYYTRRVVSDASAARGAGTGQFGTETELDGGARDVFSGFHAEMPTEGPLTDAGLEVYPRGIYDLVMQMSREYAISGDRDHGERVQLSGCAVPGRGRTGAGYATDCVLPQLPDRAGAGDPGRREGAVVPRVDAAG